MPCCLLAVLSGFAQAFAIVPTVSLAGTIGWIQDASWGCVYIWSGVYGVWTRAWLVISKGADVLLGCDDLSDRNGSCRAEPLLHRGPLVAQSHDRIQSGTTRRRPSLRVRARKVRGGATDGTVYWTHWGFLIQSNLFKIQIKPTGSLLRETTPDARA